MLEGFRFGAPGSPSPLKRAKTAPAEEPVARTDDPVEDSWHVSDSVEEDDVEAEDDDAATSAAVVGMRDDDRGNIVRAEDGGVKNAKHVEDAGDARVVVRKEEHEKSDEVLDDRRLTYGDAVDADDAHMNAHENRKGTVTCASTSAKTHFFFPRGHPGHVPDPVPDDWRSVWNVIASDRAERAAPVDQFHAFLLSLRDAPDAHFQALVASLLSVQVRDSVALLAARRLREALGGEITVDAVRDASLEVVSDAISTLNFRNVKAKYVKACASLVKTRYKGQVPSAVKELEKLPGVGPKLARLVSSVAFGDDGAGIVVDTHVRRVVGRLGWTNGFEKRSAEKTRKRLERFLPKREWGDITLALVGFGQNTCTPLRPRCHECPVAKRCPSYQLDSRKNEKRNRESGGVLLTDLEDA